MGTVIGVTAFLMYLLREFSEKPVLATITELLSVFPVLLVFIVAGVLVDRLDRKKIAYYSHFICAGLSIGLLIGVYIESIPVMFFFIFLRTVVHYFFSISEITILQGILSEDDYVVASGVNQLVGSVLDIFGKTLGVTVFWIFGVQGAIIIDSISFVLAGILIYLCKVPKEVRLPNGVTDLKDFNITGVFSEFRDTIIMVYKEKKLAVLLSAYFTMGLVNGIMGIIPIFLLKYSLSPNNYEQYIMWEGIAVGVGIVIGTLFASSLNKKLKAYQYITGGMAFLGLSMIVLSQSVNPYMFVVVMVFVALAIPFISMGLGGTLLKLVDSSKMGGVASIITPLINISSMTMLVAIALLFPAYLSAIAFLIIVGAILMTLSVFYAFHFPKQVKAQTEA